LIYYHTSTLEITRNNSTDHALHLLIEQVHAAWNNKLPVASMLAFDVTGAFNNASHRRLIHNLRKRHMPPVIVE
jgi:hypothetical protein